MPKNEGMLNEEKTDSLEAARVSHASGMEEAPPVGQYSGPPVEQLANESGYSLEFVQDLYQRQVVFLGDGARIRAYIPVLAMKRVRDALRGDRRATHARSRVRPHPTGHQVRHERTGNGGR